MSIEWPGWWWLASSLGLAAALILAAVASCPSHDSFATYLAAMAQHPSGLLGGISSIFESARIAVGAESSSWLVLRVAKYRGALYVGAFGTCGIDMAGNPCQLLGVVDGTRLRVDQKRIACPETRQPVLQKVKERFLCGVFDNQA